MNYFLNEFSNLLTDIENIKRRIKEKYDNLQIKIKINSHQSNNKRKAVI